MMKRFQFSLIALLLAITSYGQYFTVGDEARTYQDAVQQAKDFCDAELEKGFDFTLHWSERIIIPVSFEDTQNGNAGYEFHGVDEVVDYVQGHVQEKVAAFIVDDCGGYTNDAIPWLPEFAKTFTGETVVNQARHSHHVAGINGGFIEGTNLGIASPLSSEGNWFAIPLKALNNSGSGQYAWVASALFYVKQVIPQLRMRGFTKFTVNMSLGGSSDSDLVNQALKELEELDVVIIAAAGNTGQPPVQFPGRSIYTTATGALTVTNGIPAPASYTSQGEEVILSAEGTNVYSCGPNNTFLILSGTSMGAPQVTGMAGLLMAVEPELTNDQVVDRMVEGSIDVPPDGKDVRSGYGYPVAKYVLKIEDNPDEPDNPDNPGDPDPPNPPNPPTFTSNLTYQMQGAGMKYKSTTQANFQEMKLEDLTINVTGQGNTNAVYKSNNNWSIDYFRRTYLVTPDRPDWGHCLTAYWCGQFYEYTSRNQGIGAQVSFLEGVDYGGERCIQTQFDRASDDLITSYINKEGVLVMEAKTEYGIVTAYQEPERKKCGLIRRIFKRCDR